MKIIEEEKFTNEVGDWYLYYFDDLKGAENLSKLFGYLKSLGHDMSDFSLSYVYDHADDRPSLKCQSPDEVLEAYKRESDSEAVGDISFHTVYNNKRMNATVGVNSGMLRFIEPQKKNEVGNYSPNSDAPEQKEK